MRTPGSLFKHPMQPHDSLDEQCVNTMRFLSVDMVLPPPVLAQLAVEAGVTQGWHRDVGDAGDVIGIDRFGAAARGETVLREYGFTIDNIYERAKALLA